MRRPSKDKARRPSGSKQEPEGGGPRPQPDRDLIGHVEQPYEGPTVDDIADQDDEREDA